MDAEEGTQVRPLCERTVSRILVIRTGALGDFILTLPVIHSIRQTFPRARISLMGNPAILSLAQSATIDIIDHNLSGLHTLYRADGAVDGRTSALMRRFDVVVSYVSDRDGILIKNLRNLGIPWVLDGAFHPQAMPTPAGELLLSPLKKAGILIDAAPPFLHPSAAERAWAQQFLDVSLPAGVNSECLVAVHPGSGSPKKCWPGEKFGALIQWMHTHLAAPVVLVQGPAEERTMDAVVSTLKGPVLVRAAHLELRRLAALLERCAAYVGNDSGVTHLAACVGVPTVAVFGPTDFHLWGPKNDLVIGLQSHYPCAPCTAQAMASCTQPRCMEALSLAEVTQALCSVLPRAHVNNGSREECCCV